MFRVRVRQSQANLTFIFIDFNNPIHHALKFEKALFHQVSVDEIPLDPCPDGFVLLIFKMQRHDGIVYYTHICFAAPYIVKFTYI